MNLKDIWVTARTLFIGQEEENVPLEIVFWGITDTELATVLSFLLQTATECTTQFNIAGAKQVVMMPSAQTAIHHVIEGNVSAVLWLSFHALPPLLFYVDRPDVMVIQYSRVDWEPLAFLAFLDLLYRLKQLTPSSRLLPNPHTLTREEQTTFMQIYQDYYGANH